MDDIFSKVRDLRAATEFQAAKQILLDALEKSGPRPRLLAKLGEICLELCDYDSADRFFSNAANLTRNLNVPVSRQPPKSCLWKITHDVEQLKYLLKRKILNRPLEAEIGRHVQVCERILSTLSKTVKPDVPFQLPADLFDLVSKYYDRIVHNHSPPKLPGPALNPNLDFKRIESLYTKREPAIIFIDDFLTSAALDEVRRHCMESTIWFDDKLGYVGAYMNDGFSSGLMMQIAKEVQEHFPEIIKNHTLKELWAYKYEAKARGINLHADPAAVNINFWITPDEANLTPDRAGMVVYPVKPPPTWDFKLYNRSSSRIAEYLETTNVEPMIIPYRQNRAVIFDSSLFHKTDDFVFRDGYPNRRVNVTLLYGNRIV